MGLVIWLIFAGLPLAARVYCYAADARVRDSCGAWRRCARRAAHSRRARVGLVASAWFSAPLAAMLYHVKPSDPPVFLSIAAALMIVAVIPVAMRHDC